MGVIGWFQHAACGRIGLHGDAKGHQSLPRNRLGTPFGSLAAGMPLVHG